jgi:hypothetical protein
LRIGAAFDLANLRTDQAFGPRPNVGLDFNADAHNDATQLTRRRVVAAVG